MINWRIVNIAESMYAIFRDILPENKPEKCKLLITDITEDDVSTVLSASFTMAQLGMLAVNFMSTFQDEIPAAITQQTQPNVSKTILGE